MKAQFHYQPLRYYAWTLLLTWAALFTAAWLSHRPDLAAYQAPLMLAGMLVPFLVAMVLINRSGVVVWRNRAFFFDQIEEAPLEKPQKERTHELATP